MKDLIMKTFRFSGYLCVFCVFAVIEFLSGCGKNKAETERILVDGEAYKLILSQNDIQEHGAVSYQEDEYWLNIEPDKIEEISALIHETLHRCGGFFSDDGSALFKDPVNIRTFAPRVPYFISDRALIEHLVGKVSQQNLMASIVALSSFKNRYYTTSTGVSSQKYIFDRWTELSQANPEVEVRYFEHKKWKQPSVILTIPGKTFPEEKVILGGHADSIQMGLIFNKEKMEAPGADDNASGIAVLTEVIRILMEEHIVPDRTIEFMAYAAEEVGLKGSKEIAELYYQQNQNVVGVLQLDMTAYAGSPSIGVITDFTDPELTEFSRNLIDHYVKTPWVNDRCGYACSDHASWTRFKYPAVTIHETSARDNNKKIHSKLDTIQYIDQSGARVGLFGRLALAFALELGTY